jgi:hypothetical protein
MRYSLCKFLLGCMMLFVVSMQAQDYNKICNNVFAYCREKYPERFESAALEDCFMKMHMLCERLRQQEKNGIKKNIIHRRVGAYDE